MNCIKSLVLCFLFVAQMFVFEVMAQTYSSSIRKWNGNTLSLDEFKGTRPFDAPDSLLSSVDYWINPVYNTMKVNGVKYTYLDYNAYLDLSNCYCVDTRKDENMRLYCQTIFDIAQLYAFKTTMEVLGTDDNPDDVMKFYSNWCTRRCREFRSVTHDGANVDMLRNYNEDVNRELRLCNIDPEKTASLYASNGMGFGASVGLGSIISFNDYIPVLYGFDVGVDFALKKQYLLGINLLIGGFGDAKKNFMTDGGMVYKGDELYGGNLFLSLGKEVSIDDKIRICPFVGLGAQVVGKSLNDYDDKKENFDKYAFAFQLGGMFDFCVKRSCFLMGNKSTMTYGTIRVKPYINVANYSEIGVSPSFNLSVSYTVQMREMIKKHVGF